MRRTHSSGSAAWKGSVPSYRVAGSAARSPSTNTASTRSSDPWVRTVRTCAAVRPLRSSIVRTVAGPAAGARRYVTEEDTTSQAGLPALRALRQAARPRIARRYPPLGLSPTAHRGWMSASNTVGSPVSCSAVVASKERSSASGMRGTLPAAMMAHDVRHGGHVRGRLPLLLRGVDRRRPLGLRHGRDPRAAGAATRRPDPRCAVRPRAHCAAAGGGGHGRHGDRPRHRRIWSRRAPTPSCLRAP